MKINMYCDGVIIYFRRRLSIAPLAWRNSHSELHITREGGLGSFSIGESILRV